MLEYSSMFQSAVFSHDRLYRYVLTRSWASSMPCAVWIGLNPSTADEEQDDPTIRRIIGFSRGFGYGGLVMLNLFAFRTPYPKEMFAEESAGLDVVGPANDSAIRELCRGRTVFAAWGAHGGFGGRENLVKALLQDAGAKVLCMGKTKDGHPKHPLYLKAESTPVVFE